MSLIHNTEFCIGCRACQQACQDYHNLTAGKKLMEIVEKEKFADGVLSVTYVMNTCRQCNHARCLEACPQSAIGRNAQGVVIIDENRCIGCSRCERACPFNRIVMQEKTEGRKALKCMECVERQNGKSVCQEACPILCITRGE